MTLEQRNSIQRNILYFMIYVIMGLAAIALFFSGPRLEALLYPPVGLFDIQEVTRVDEDHVRVSGVLYKNRGECTVEEVIATTGGPPGDPNTEILNVDFQDNLRNRPGGGQVWGPWIIEEDQFHGPVFTVYASHRCHFFWNVQSILYRSPTSVIFGDQP